MRTIWHRPFDGEPAVFVCNHDSAYGPMAMCAHFDQKAIIRPWINAQVLSPRQVPAYVRQDFWWPRNRWYTKILDYTLVYPVSLLLPAIVHGSACVPVYHNENVEKTFAGSVDALSNGYSLILFPERPTDYKAYDERIYSGFTALGRMFKGGDSAGLKFYPTYVDWTGKEIRVGAPITYDASGEHREQSIKVLNGVQDFFSNSGKIG